METPGAAPSRAGPHPLSGRAFVVGPGEVGKRLGAALAASGWEVLPVTRSAGWTAALDRGDLAPRIVAVREEALEGVLERLAPIPRERLVLVQNGFIEAVCGELGPVTRGLIWFTAKGEFFRVLAPSVFCGPLAAEVVRPLVAAGIDAANEPDPARFTRAMVLKGLWNAVVGLPLAVHETDLAGYLGGHRDELGALIDESARAASAEYRVSVGAEEALRCLSETTEALGWVRGGAKALAFRNGALARFGRLHGVPTPVNDRLLAAVGYPDSPQP